MKRFSHTAQLLYSELLEELRSLSIPQTRGLSFVNKKIKTGMYWYTQYTIGAIKKQSFIGPDSEELRGLIDQFKSNIKQASVDIEKAADLVRMLKQNKCYSPLKGEFRVLQMLDTMGYFRAGGILVGSHAFFSYSNMLGVSFKGQDLRTSDIDLVPDTRIMLALPNNQGSFRDSVLGSGFDFFEIPKLNHKHPSTSFSSRKEDIKLDLLTPMHGKTSHKPVYIKAIDGYAEPIRFLDYLLDDVQQAAVIEGSGMLINIPHPARYAIHKLMLSARRPVADSLKRRKDLRQSELLIDILKEDDPHSLVAAFKAAAGMPDKFMQQVKSGIGRLSKDNQNFLNEML